MQAHKKPDRATRRGVSAALASAFNGSADLPPEHVAADAAAAEFEALLAQLNDPPAAYREARATMPSAGARPGQHGTSAGADQCRS